MSTARLATYGLLAIFIVGAITLIVLMPDVSRTNDPSGATATAVVPLRLGLAPESDVLDRRRGFQAMAEYLEERLGRPVQLVTWNREEQLVHDLAEGRIDLACAGAMVAALAHERIGAQLLVRPVRADEPGVERGAILVRDDTAITSVEQLAGRSVALTRMSASGELYFMWEMARHDALSPPVQIEWTGSAREAVYAVLEGRVDATAVPLHRVRNLLSWPLRVVAEGPPLPCCAFIARPGLSPDDRQAVLRALLSAADVPEGRAALDALDAQRLIRCTEDDFEMVHGMLALLRGRPELPAIEPLFVGVPDDEG